MHRVPRLPSWCRVGSPPVNAVLVLGFFGLWWLLYDFTNERGAASPQALQMVRPVDTLPGIILPWTAVIYVFGGLALPVLPFLFYRSAAQLTFVLACYALTSALAFTCYLLWPVSIVRPDYEGDGVGAWLMRQVLSLDRAANCLPSSHVFLAVLAALLVSRAAVGRGGRAAVWTLAAAVSATTITTGQHYYLDVLGGVAVALVGYGITRLLLPVPVLADRASRA